MIKRRLFQLLAGGKKYIVYNVVWQWMALIGQIIFIFAAVFLLSQAVTGMLTVQTMAGGTGVIALAIILRAISSRQATLASYKASADVKCVLRQRIYNKLLRLGASYTEQVATSEVVQMASEGVEQLEIYFGRYLPQLFYSLLAPLTLFATLAFIDLRASVVLLICVPLIPISIVLVQKLAKRLLNKYWGIYTELGDSFLENLQGLTTLKIYQADGVRAQAMDIEAEHFRKITMKVLTMQLNSISIMDIVAYGGASIGMVVAVGGFLDGRIDLAGTSIILLLSSEFFIPLRLLGSFFHIAMNGMAASDKIFHLLDLPEPVQGTRILSEAPGEIMLGNIHFSYTPDREILKGISMSFPVGSLTAIVGQSGCGKSTIAGILTGRNQGYSGQVFIGNISLNTVSEDSRMAAITLVSHNSYLFKGTVAENLRLGKPSADDKDLWAALKEVNLAEFIRNQQGLDTQVAERGSNFSGGQCQRLVLARALLRDSPVYIFDEATSNIDMESESMIMTVIHKLAVSHTVILIAHRLANVVDADTIYMLSDGQVVEAGSHTELMAAGGIYSRLYNSQHALETYGEVK